MNSSAKKVWINVFSRSSMQNTEQFTALAESTNVTTLSTALMAQMKRLAQSRNVIRDSIHVAMAFAFLIVGVVTIGVTALKTAETRKRTRAHMNVSTEESSRKQVHATL
ncbi:uncharacterized protein LOC117106451 [Anneissia japonica]|uniref:uncharacterized protein LOC117106451 n=1 Tax=Anneissia japonica TaxID=1529436 RepID=UPI001425A15B|nr:uncharacterized protein LOC117106451 [Anneissia japonica]